MGITLSIIEKMQGLGLFGTGRISVLDVGSSNLYSASAEGVRKFLSGYGVASTPEIEKFVEKLANGSGYDAVNGGVNGAFAGELFEKAGIRYHAIDIADGYGTTILDLNHEPAPTHFVGVFDLVLNFGTTEHLLNQYNAFKVIHDSTKVGGYIVHSLPCVGYSNHGYFTYTPRCMFDLAGYNEYELVGFWFEGPGGGNDLYAPIRDYLTYFPNLSRTLADRDLTKVGRQVAKLDIPDLGLVVVFRKVKPRPFAGALERSTSVGTVPTSVTSGYETDSGRDSSRPHSMQRTEPLPSRLRVFARRLRAYIHRIFFNKNTSGATVRPLSSASTIARHDEIVLDEKAEKLRNRFVLQALGLDECLVFYSLVVEAHGYFPYDWEYRILLLGLEHEPGRRDLAERLAVVRGNL